MTYEAVREQVIRSVAERVDGGAGAMALLAQPDEDSSFSDLAVDSLSSLDLCLALEDLFSLPFEPSHLMLYPSVNSLAHYIVETKRGKRAANHA